MVVEDLHDPLWVGTVGVDQAVEDGVEGGRLCSPEVERHGIEGETPTAVVEDELGELLVVDEHRVPHGGLPDHVLRCPGGQDDGRPCSFPAGSSPIRGRFLLGSMDGNGQAPAAEVAPGPGGPPFGAQKAGPTAVLVVLVEAVAPVELEPADERAAPGKVASTTGNQRPAVGGRREQRDVAGNDDNVEDAA